MGFRKYIIRNGGEEAWLTHIFLHGGQKVWQYLPDARKAITFETVHEARKYAKECRGRVQILRMGRDGKGYGEDIGNE